MGHSRTTQTDAENSSAAPACVGRAWSTLTVNVHSLVKLRSRYRKPTSMPRGDKPMSYSISTLLTRNLHDVFGENDPAHRRAAIDEIFTEDCVFYEPRGVHHGRDEIDRVAGAIKATHPDFRYQPIAEPEELGNGGRVPMGSGRPGAGPAYAVDEFLP